MKLGKKTEALYEQAAALHKQLDRYAYGAPAIRFTDADVDQARAAGVVIQFDRGQPVIVDRALYRELVKQATARAVTELEAKVATREADRKTTRRDPDRAVDPVAEARRDEQRQLRELAEQAHGVNLDLGASLMNGPSVVDPADMDVARLLVYGLLGADYHGSAYGQTGERVSQLAMTGIRLVIDEFRSDVTKTRKDGSRGKLRIDYGDPHDRDTAVKWLWTFVDGAKTAGELYGRAIVVIAAEQYASRLVVPTSQRASATGWSSHKDQAAKALKKLAGPHLPASLRQLETAVKRAHRDYETTANRAGKKGRRELVDHPAQAAESDELDVGDAALAESEDEGVQVDIDEDVDYSPVA